MPGATCSPLGMGAQFYLLALVPDLEEAVPGPRGHGHAIIGHSEAADAVVMTSQDTWEGTQLRDLQAPGGSAPCSLWSLSPRRGWAGTLFPTTHTDSILMGHAWGASMVAQ